MNVTTGYYNEFVLAENQLISICCATDDSKVREAVNDLIRVSIKSDCDGIIKFYNSDDYDKESLVSKAFKISEVESKEMIEKFRECFTLKSITDILELYTVLYTMCAGRDVLSNEMESRLPHGVSLSEDSIYDNPVKINFDKYSIELY